MTLYYSVEVNKTKIATHAVFDAMSEIMRSRVGCLATTAAYPIGASVYLGGLLV